MIDDDTTAFCEALHSPSNVPDAISSATLTGSSTGRSQFPISTEGRGRAMLQQPGHTHMMRMATVTSPVCMVRAARLSHGLSPNLSPVCMVRAARLSHGLSLNLSSSPQYVSLSCLRSWNSCHPSPTCRCLLWSNGFTCCARARGGWPSRLGERSLSTPST